MYVRALVCAYAKSAQSKSCPRTQCGCAKRISERANAEAFTGSDGAKKRSEQTPADTRVFFFLASYVSSLYLSLSVRVVRRGMRESVVRVGLFTLCL